MFYAVVTVDSFPVVIVGVFCGCNGGCFLRLYLWTTFVVVPTMGD